MWSDALLERGLVPDALIRREIRRVVARWLAEERAVDAGEALAREERLVAAMRERPVAAAGGEEDARPDEGPPGLPDLVLGARRLSSCALFADGAATLDAAEEAMLALACERARLVDGQNVLDLGCGRGALALYVAERFPQSRVVAVAASGPEREAVEESAATRNLSNVKVVSCDLGSFDPATGPAFDRVVSAETFGRVANWPELLGRIASWLKPDGRLFLQVASHRELSSPGVARGEADGLARNPCAGGLVPSDHLVLRFPEHLWVEERWRVSGTHYARTAEAWLANLDRNRRAARALLAKAGGPAAARRGLLERRLSLLSRAELFGARGGSEWMVSQYRLRRRYV
ncbi:MAG: class I SAM-dependent methyltransferase [Thermoanaerobaculia bacterium]